MWNQSKIPLKSKRDKWLKVKNGQVVYFVYPNIHCSSCSLLPNFGGCVNADKVNSEMRLDMNVPGGIKSIQRHVHTSQIDFNLLKWSLLKQVKHKKHHWSQGFINLFHPSSLAGGEVGAFGQEAGYTLDKLPAYCRHIDWRLEQTTIHTTVL